MLHGITSGTLLPLAASITLVALSGGPALAKTKVSTEQLRQACIGAFGDHDHFSWTPLMGLQNALATCATAEAQFPDDADVRLAHALARDQFAERGGSQADNAHATEVYRTLAADGLARAEYALGTMFDEEVGVSKADALATMQRALAGEFGQAIHCETLRTFGVVDMDGNGPSYDVATADRLAHGNPVCAGYVVNMFWRGHVTSADLSLPISDYARYAAAHGDAESMALVGLFYAHGSASTTIEPLLQGQFSTSQDIERAGKWLLLAHWATKSHWNPQAYQNFWDYEQLLRPEVVRPMQTALIELGFYDGPVDGLYSSNMEMALAAFEATDVDALFQALRAKEKYHPALGAREPVHIGPAAMLGAD